MQPDYLHNHPEFSSLTRIVGEKKSINPTLIEKDYWIMHCLYGLQQLDLAFEIKGGTSLSKGHRLIRRFSEDIDLRIKPPEEMGVKFGKNHDKPIHRESREKFYNWLVQTIKIDGIVEAKRDTSFDDKKARNAGVQLCYSSDDDEIAGGILLEVGFDNVTPNEPIDISSWAYDFAADKVEIIDNRAKNVACYHPGYTFVEKLQAISTKYRQQQKDSSSPRNFMRHYYDVYCLLQSSPVLDFIGTENYKAHKEKRFRQGDNLIIADNEAFLLSDPQIYQTYKQAYQSTSQLYYEGQPDFEKIMGLIKTYIDKL